MNSWKSIILKNNGNNIVSTKDNIKLGWVSMTPNHIYVKNGKKHAYGEIIYNYNVPKDIITLDDVMINHDNYKENYDIIHGENAYNKKYGYIPDVFESDSSSEENLSEIEVDEEIDVSK